MKRLSQLVVAVVLVAGCSRLVVEIPDSALSARPSGPRIGLVHVRDARPSPGRLGKLGFERYDVRPVPADLLTQAIRTTLERRGCVVAEMADPEGMDAKSLRAFLWAHRLRSVVRVEIEDFSLTGFDATFGRAAVTSKVHVRVIPADGEPGEQTIWHVERSWAGWYMGWGESRHVERMTRDAVMETARKVLEAEALREAMGLEGDREGKGERG